MNFLIFLLVVFSTIVMVTFFQNKIEKTKLNRWIKEFTTAIFGIGFMLVSYFSFAFLVSNFDVGVKEKSYQTNISDEIESDSTIDFDKQGAYESY